MAAEISAAAVRGPAKDQDQAVRGSGLATAAPARVQAPEEPDSGRAARERATAPDQAAPVRVGQGWVPAATATVRALAVWAMALVRAVSAMALVPGVSAMALVRAVSVRVLAPAGWATARALEATASVRAVSVTDPVGEQESGTDRAVPVPGTGSAVAGSVPAAQSAHPVAV
ncbi:MAG TPA: hypothetical protein VH502_02875 [Actinoplanes sp.]